MSEAFQHTIDANVQGAIARHTEAASDSWWVGKDRAQFRQRLNKEITRIRNNRQFGAVDNLTRGKHEMSALERSRAQRRIAEGL